MGFQAQNFSSGSSGLSGCVEGAMLLCDTLQFLLHSMLFYCIFHPVFYAILCDFTRFSCFPEHCPALVLYHTLILPAASSWVGGALKDKG